MMVKRYNLDNIKSKKQTWDDLTEEEKKEFIKSGADAIKVVSRLFEKLEKEKA